MKRVSNIVLGGLFLMSMSLGSGVGIAQDTTTTTDDETVVFESVPDGPELATELDIEAEDLGVEEPNWLSNIRRVVSRFFTRNQVKKARIDLELANITLLRARQALGAGDETRAQELLDSYNEQIAAASAKLQELVDELGSTDANVASLIDQATEDNLLQASALDSLSLKATREFNQKILQARIQALKLLSDLLLKQNLTPERLAARVEQLSRVLERKESKAQEKYVRRLAVTEEVDEVSDDDDLEGAIEETEDEVEDEIADLDDEDLEEVADQITEELDNHLVVLQDLIDKLPEPAKAAIQRILDRQLTVIQSDAAKDPAVLDALLLKKNEREAEVLKKLIERLKETLKNDEQAKKELERQEKAVERLREAEKKRLERLRENRTGSDDDSDDASDDDSSGSSDDDEDDDDSSGSGSGR